MKFIIHLTIWDYEDSLVIEWENIEEIREKAKYEYDRRWASDAWSEQIED